MSNSAQRDRDGERVLDCSPTDRSPFGFPQANEQFSRCSSNGSLHNVSSPSAANSGSFFVPSPEDVDDDDDSDSKSSSSNFKDRKREAHTQAEQKRRDSIKRGYDALQELVPTCAQLDSVSGYKLSKAIVLQRSIDYIQFLSQQKTKLDGEISSLRKEVVALQIMKANYEQIVESQQNRPGPSAEVVPDSVKFEVLRRTLEGLYQSFDQSVSVNNFAELSGCVFTWLEEFCKPQSLRDLLCAVLQETAQEFENSNNQAGARGHQQPPFHGPQPGGPGQQPRMF